MDTKQELHLLREVNLDDLLTVATDQQVSAPTIGLVPSYNRPWREQIPFVKMPKQKFLRQA